MNYGQNTDVENRGKLERSAENFAVAGFYMQQRAKGVLHTKWHKRSPYSSTRKTGKSIRGETEMYHTLTNQKKKDEQIARREDRRFLSQINEFLANYCIIVIEKFLIKLRVDSR